MMIFLTTDKTEAKAEIEARKGWNRKAKYEVRRHDTGAFGLWVTYSNCNYAHWAREF